MEHPSLTIKEEPTAKKESPRTERSLTIHEQLKQLNEQMVVFNRERGSLDVIRREVGALHLQLENIEAELVGFKPYIEKKIELLDTELRIARMFEAFLKKQTEK